MQDFDMKSYMGENSDSAAVNQSQYNSFTPVDDYPVQSDLLEQPAKAIEEIQVHEAQPEKHPQAENFRALREEVDKMKSERESERREFESELRMLRANQTPRNQPEPRQERKFLEGLKEDDVPSVAELRREWDAREATYAAKLEEIQVAQQYSDYQEIIEKHTLPLVQQKPHLAEGIQGARNKALFAYELGKMYQQMQAQASPAVQQSITPPISNNAERMIANSKKPGNIGSASGQGALSKADYIATMSDKEFLDYANRHLDQI